MEKYVDLKDGGIQVNEEFEGRIYTSNYDADGYLVSNSNTAIN
jgi:hypothetical protein